MDEKMRIQSIECVVDIVWVRAENGKSDLNIPQIILDACL
jgi:hypothetical protein